MIGRQATRAADRFCVVTVITTMLATSAIGRAQDQAQVAPADGLSLRAAIARAIEREPGLRAERTDVDVARGTLSQTRLKPNPMLSVGRQQQPGGTDNQTNLTVEWPLDLFRKAGRVTVAEREVDRAQFHLADRERLLAAEVRAAYGAAVASRRDLEVFDEIAAAAARQSELVGGRVDEGAAPPIERDLLAVERRRIDADRLMNAARADAALMVLKRLLGVAPADRLTLRDTLESLVNVNDAPAPLVDQAVLGERPDVREADANLRMAEASIDRARREGRLDLSLFGTYTRMRTTFPQLGFTPIGALQPVGDTFHYLAAGATLTIPLRNNNSGEIAATEARRAGAEARREAAGLQARTEVAAASMLDQQARAAVEMYAKNVRPLARQNVEIIRQTYELGRGTVADVLNEQRRYLEIERAYTDALKQAYDARTSLLSALGDAAMTVAAASRSLVVSLLGIGIAVGGGVTYLALRRPPTATSPAASANASGSRLKSSDPSVTLTAEAVAKANIAVTPAESATLGGVITIPGIIEPNAYKETVVTALVAGRVTRVLAELGQHVRRGQTLAELHSPELAEAQREFISVSAELGAHERQLARTERLVAIGSASRQELEMAHAEHTALTTKVEGARSRLQLLGLAPDQIASLTSASQITATTDVRAPLDGVVTIRQANVGLNVEGTMPLFTVVDLSTVWVVGDLYEPDFPRVRVGSLATIVVSSYPDLSLHTTISYIDPQLSRETRTAKLRAEVPNRQGQLRLGMYAQMQIGTGRGGVAVPVIPRTAIQIIGDHAVVYVADPQTPGRFMERSIRTGQELGDRIAVESGIAVGESVVSGGSFFLRAERERLGLSDSGASSQPIANQPSLH